MSRRASKSGGDRNVKVVTELRRFWFSGKLVHSGMVVYSVWRVGVSYSRVNFAYDLVSILKSEIPDRIL